jgi:hypothetical protein
MLKIVILNEAKEDTQECHPERSEGPNAFQCTEPFYLVLLYYFLQTNSFILRIIQTSAASSDWPCRKGLLDLAA